MGHISVAAHHEVLDADGCVAENLVMKAGLTSRGISYAPAAQLPERAGNI